MKLIAAACATAVLATSVGVNAPPGVPERSARLDVGLAAAVQPAPGALITQFLANQAQNCSLICPFVVQGAVQVPAVQPAPGALITQFLANQAQNCSLICPFVVQGAVQVPAALLQAPGTFLTQLQAGQPLVQALGAGGATVSGAANDVWTGLIRTDLDQVVPRTEFGTEVIAVTACR